MEPVQESRQPQRLYVPSRSSLRPDGAPSASRASAQKPSGAEPWVSDHPWQPAGQEADYATGKDLGLLGRGIVLLLIALSNIALASSIPILRDLAAFLDVFGLVLLGDTLLRIWQSRRRPLLRWTTFPAFVGGRLEAVLVARPPLEPIGQVRALLRCVRDEPASRPAPTVPGGEVTFESTFEPMVIYQQISEISVVEDRLKELPLSFEIPADLPGTDLGREDATYWQVALRIPVVGPDVEIVFLAPVYVRPS